MNNEFKELKIQVEKLNQQKWYYYKKWKEFDRKYNEMRKQFEKNCSHEWERIENGSPGFTQYECINCGAYIYSLVI